MPQLGTPAQKNASRQNGKLGGRPRKDTSHGELRRLREEAREQGRLAALENPRFWRDVRDDSRVDMRTRLEAARELADRYGEPRQQVTALLNQISDDPPKLFDMAAYEAPESYSEHPPPESPNGKDTAH